MIHLYDIRIYMAQANPEPFTVLAKVRCEHTVCLYPKHFLNSVHEIAFTTQELFPGNFEPTHMHHFMRLLHDKGLLLRCFSQNIDSLVRRPRPAIYRAFMLAATVWVVMLR